SPTAEVVEHAAAGCCRIPDPGSKRDAYAFATHVDDRRQHTGLTRLSVFPDQSVWSWPLEVHSIRRIIAYGPIPGGNLNAGSSPLPVRDDEHLVAKGGGCTTIPLEKNGVDLCGRCRYARHLVSAGAGEAEHGRG